MLIVLVFLEPGSTGGSGASSSSSRNSGSSATRGDDVDPLDKLFLTESDFVDVESLRRGGKSGK